MTQSSRTMPKREKCKKRLTNCPRAKPLMMALVVGKTPNNMTTTLIIGRNELKALNILINEALEAGNVDRAMRLHQSKEIILSLPIIKQFGKVKVTTDEQGRLVSFENIISERGISK